MDIAQIRKLFGGEIPNEAYQLVFNAPDDMTVGEVREKLVDMAKKAASPKVKLVQTANGHWHIYATRLPFDLAKLVVAELCDTFGLEEDEAVSHVGSSVLTRGWKKP